MGAWGHGHFENDTALDFMADIEDSADPKAAITAALEEALQGGYLDSDIGASALVAAAYVDRQVNGTRYSEEGSEEPLEVDTFPERYPHVDLSNLRAKALTAVKRVLQDDSELNELWAEAEDDYPAWKQEVQRLIHNLEQQ